MKQILRSFINRFGYDIIRKVEMPMRPFAVLPYLLKVAANDPNFFFLQIGANDGKRNDPIHASVVKHRLRGLLVEPLPDLFDRLKSNYQGYEKLQFEQAAITTVCKPVTMYRIRADAGLPDWVQGIASLDRRHLSGNKFGIEGLESHIEEVSVPGITFSELLRRFGIEKVSLLQIDTEGFDCEIVKMALSSGLEPDIINYEYVHTPPDKRFETKQLLANSGYDFLDIGRDTLAVKGSPWLA